MWTSLEPLTRLLKLVVKVFPDTGPIAFLERLLLPVRPMKTPKNGKGDRGELLLRPAAKVVKEGSSDTHIADVRTLGDPIADVIHFMALGWPPSMPSLGNYGSKQCRIFESYSRDEQRCVRLARGIRYRPKQALLSYPVQSV